MGQQIELALRQSMHRVVPMLVSFLPGLLAFLLAVVILAVIGVVLAIAIRKILTVMRFDERLAARQTPGVLTNVSEWSPSSSPTLLLSRVVLWLCVLAGIAIGLSAFNASFSDNGRVSLFFLPYVTHIVGATLLVIAGTLLARFLARSVLIGAVNAQLQYARFLSLGIKWLVLVLTAAMALEHLGIGGGVVELAFGILFGGIVLTLALAIGLGSRDLVSRSIEKTIEKPSALNPNVASTPETAQPPLRHF
ncbi:MAG TPA: hypothetical protein VIJ79_15450 [Acidobacteriaceae bacterium]